MKLLERIYKLLCFHQGSIISGRIFSKNCMEISTNWKFHFQELLGNYHNLPSKENIPHRQPTSPSEGPHWAPVTSKWDHHEKSALTNSRPNGFVDTLTHHHILSFIFILGKWHLVFSLIIMSFSFGLQTIYISN